MVRQMIGVPASHDAALGAVGVDKSKVAAPNELGQRSVGIGVTPRIQRPHQRWQGVDVETWDGTRIGV